MKRIILILTILLSISFFILNPKKEVDYSIKTGNELTSKHFGNNFVSQISNKVDVYEMIIPIQFELVSENNYLSLYLEKETMAIAILNKSNHYVWYSYDTTRDYHLEIENKSISQEMVNQIKSGIIMQTYNVFTPGIRTLLDKDLLGKDMVSISYDMEATGFIAHVDFTNISIKFDVIVSIDEADLVIEIPREKVSEYDPKLWVPGNKDVSMSNLLIYPFLGSTEQKENGYMVIPDGSGAIVSLEETPIYNLSYSAPIYGKDLGYTELPEPSSLNVLTIKPLASVTLPIYGIIHDVGNSGLLVISESGENYATYNYVSKDVTTDYYQSYFHYNYRTSYKQFQSRTNTDQHILGFQEEPNRFELKQRYVFLSGDEANYVGVAKRYRNYLEQHNQFIQTNESKNYSTKIDLIGNEIERGIIWDKNVAITPYKDAVQLTKKLRSDGYTNLDITYKTFNKSDYSYHFDVYRNLGGKEEFDNMIQYFEDNNIDFNYYVDYINRYEDSKYSASRMNRKVLADINYSYMYLYSYINNAKYLPQFVEDDYPSYKKYGIDRLAIDGLNKGLYTHTEKNAKVKYSTENMAYILEALNYLSENNIKTNLYNPNAYLFKYTNKYYDAPISSSELLFISATIPLVELIVSGHMEMYSPYLNFISSEDNTLLRLVEYGINPAYILTSKNTYKLKYTNASHVYVSQYASLSNRMETYDDFIKQALNEISGVEMINHYFFKEGVTVTEYANGKKVIVNYTDETVQFEDTTIKAKGYEVI